MSQFIYSILFLALQGFSDGNLSEKTMRIGSAQGFQRENSPHSTHAFYSILKSTQFMGKEIGKSS